MRREARASWLKFSPGYMEIKWVGWERLRKGMVPNSTSEEDV